MTDTTAALGNDDELKLFISNYGESREWFAKDLNTLIANKVQSEVTKARIDELEALPRDVHIRHATRTNVCVPVGAVNDRLKQLKKGD